MLAKLVLRYMFPSAPSRLVLIWIVLSAAWISCFPHAVTAQTQTDSATGPPVERGNLPLQDFRPRSMLRVEQTNLTAARYPVIDVHTHFRIRTQHSNSDLDRFVEVMDRNNIAMCVSLDGQLGDALREHQAYLYDAYPNRFAIFANLDFVGDGDLAHPATLACNQSDFVRHQVESLRAAKEAGACGLKIFKQFGLGYRNLDGSLVRIDDQKWDPIWNVCGELQLPVLMHIADPAAFFLTIDAQNERWEELSRHPEWSFPSDRFPERNALIDARNRVIARHPKTVFIAAHVASSAEDLATVGQWLEQYPNLNLEFASRIGELGRQPYTARAFFLKYPDRILFGTDGPWPEKRLHLYWRFLETFDEYFPYSEKEFPPQGFWNIYGIGLPDDVLRKVYHENALRLIPSLREKFDRSKKRAK